MDFKRKAELCPRRRDFGGMVPPLGQQGLPIRTKMPLHEGQKPWQGREGAGRNDVRLLGVEGFGTHRLDKDIDPGFT